MFHLAFPDAQVTGASPEVLVRVEDKRVMVRPIAGTRPRGRTEEDDARLEAELLADPKERAEHVMLIDLGRNDVGRVARIGSVRVDEQMVVERYSHVMHLVSHVSGVLEDGRSALDVLRACFPGRHAVGRAEDPRDGDHRGARAVPPRAVRRRGRLPVVHRQPRLRDRHPHAGDRAATRSTCRRAPASSPTAIPRPSTRRP